MQYEERIDLITGRVTYVRPDGARVTEDGAGGWRAVPPAGSGWSPVLGHFPTPDEAMAAIEQAGDPEAAE